jgi:hypothetical protein
MALGSHVPEWKALHAQLDALVQATGATSAAVIDATNALWCAAPLDGQVEEAADRFYRTVVDGAGVRLRRGERVTVARFASPTEAGYVAESFASIYVLVLWLAGPFAPDLVRAQMKRALPRIEALVVALPPQGGPGAGEGARGMRA